MTSVATVAALARIRMATTAAGLISLPIRLTGTVRQEGGAKWIRNP
jgi:hypothetical protein